MKTIDYMHRHPCLVQNILRMAKLLELVYVFSDAWYVRLHGAANLGNNDQRTGISNTQYTEGFSAMRLVTTKKEKKHTQLDGSVEHPYNLPGSYPFLSSGQHSRRMLKARLIAHAQRNQSWLSRNGIHVLMP